MGDHLFCCAFVPGWAEGGGSTFSAPCRVPPCRSLPPRSGPGLPWLPVCCCSRAFVTSMGSAWTDFAFLGMLGPPPNELETQSLIGVFRRPFLMAQNVRSGLKHDIFERLAARETVQIGSHHAPAPVGGRLRAARTMRMKPQPKA